MAAWVRRGPPITAPLIVHSLHHKSVVAQSPDVPVIHANGHRFSVKLIIAILVGVVVIALFALGFFTAYLRRFIRNRNAAADAAAIAAVTAAAIANPPNRRRRGLDRAVIDSFPSIPFSDVQCIKSNKLRYGPECAICLSGFTDEEMLRLLPGCRHVFHAACIDTWLSSHITCPVCRADLSDPLVAAAGQSLMVDLAEERCSDAVEIVVEVFHPDLDPDPDPNPDADTELHQIMAYPENARQELDSAIRQHRRAASLISFHGRRSAPVESILRNSSIRRQTQLDSGSGQRSSRWILQNTPRHSDPGERPGKSFLHGFQSRESNGNDASVEPRRPEQEADDKNYANYVSFAGFVIHGDVAANDWLPEIFQVSTAMQSVSVSPPSN